MNIPKEWAGKITDVNNENNGMFPAQVCKCRLSNKTVYFKSIDMKYRNTHIV